MPKEIIKSVIFCEQIRAEITGYQTIIGAYPGRVVVPFLPVILRQFWIRFEVFTNGEIINSFDVRLLDPSGNEKIKYTLTINFIDYSRPGALAIISNDLQVDEAGIYKLQARRDENSDWINIRELFIDMLSPQSEEPKMQ
ncbi:DUF6941 family protein [Komagataeibacter xylinus]|nr:hypothetical protein [Komagataeibacter xylinus]